MNNNSNCPICNSSITEKLDDYTTQTLLNLWDIDFSKKVIDEHISQSKSTSLYCCRGCNFQYFFPIVYGTPLFYSELESKSKYYEDDKWDFHVALNLAKSSKGKILEIGSGPGNFLKLCNDININCFGSEYNELAFEKATKSGISMIKPENLTTLKGSFDMVFSFHVLEHVSNPIEFLEFHSLMVKEGGKICISVPNLDGPISYINPCIMNMPPHHLTRWSLKSFQKAALNLGLRIVDVKYEPLLLSNHSYYSHFLLKKIFKEDSKLQLKIMSYINRFLFRIFQFMITRLNMKYFTPLKGMAILVVFEKK
jgi:2-polyprenyl-3-methyl-5-hydroxy-6-metoxy-1,4-benzoquinol methylase